MRHRRWLVPPGFEPTAYHGYSRIVVGDGLGSREYVEAMFEACRERFGPRRKTGARRVRGVEDGDLYVARALRVNVFG